MLLDLPLTRPLAAPRLTPAALIARFAAWRRARRALAAIADGLARRDAATGLAERRPATLWLHAMAGIAARRGERLTLALVRADHARPAAIARALQRATPAGGLAARWSADTYMLAAPMADAGAMRASLERALRIEGVQARIGLATGAEPDELLESAAAA